MPRLPQKFESKQPTHKKPTRSPTIASQDETQSKVLERLNGVEEFKGSHRALCPSHADHRPSLNIKMGSRGILLKCWAGCSLNDILGAIGLRPSDLFFQPIELNSSKKNTAAKRRIVATYDYCDASDNLIFQTVRFLPKGFSQRRPDGHGGDIWNLQGVQLVLYHLRLVLAALVVLIIEGEKDVDAAYGLGLPSGYAATTAPMGAGKWRPEYSETLRGKRVIIWPDRDGPGKKHGDQIAAALNGIAAEILWLEAPQGKDLSEWATATGATAADLQALLESALPVQIPPPIDPAGPEETGNSDGRAADSQATRLVALVEHNAEFFHDDLNEGYITFKVGSHYETWQIGGAGLKQWAGHKYFREAGKAPSASALTDAVNTLKGMAVFDGPQLKIFIRLGGDDENVYLDLGDTEWRMVHITKDGWSVKPHGSVKFRRAAGMESLPDPVKTSEKLDTLLKPHVNISREGDLVLYVGHLVHVFRPNGAKLLLEINGEQGSGKSTACEIAKLVVDQNKANRRSVPKDETDAMICAKNNEVLCFDNLSGLSASLSDILCRMSTGGAMSTRKLFTDDEEVIFSVRRPMILNGIGAVATRPDLLDRAITITLPTIPEKNRRSEQDIWTAFENDRPKILGALCDAASCALKNLPHTKLPTLERMADALLWVTAAEEALDWPAGTFAEAYAANRQAGNQTALESSTVYEPLATLVGGLAVGVPLLDSPGAILERLSEIVGEKKAREKSWPGSPRGLRAALQRLAPNLRRVGIDVTFPARTASSRLISIVKTETFDRDKSGETEP